jgi:hypothetical protein
MQLVRIALKALLTCGFIFGVAAASAATANGDGIYSCTDASGRRLTSDRPIPECNAREQRVLNHDGSVQRVVPPTMTAEERADYEAQQQRLAAERRTQADVLRRDRNLLARYPNEAAHAKARAAALDDVRASMRASELRLKTLAADRKPLMSEAEFYVGRPMPALLRQQLDANDATTEAQRALMQNQQVELGRINASFDIELARLRKLWAGAAPGSLGPLEAVPGAAARP